jgi:hypothetical protein
MKTLFETLNAWNIHFVDILVLIETKWKLIKNKSIILAWNWGF